jgi:hypothetical protein
MSVCLNPNDKAVQNFTEKFGEDNARVLAECVNNDMIPILKVDGKVTPSHLFKDIMNNPNVTDKIHALELYLKVYSDEFMSSFNGNFDPNGEPILYDKNIVAKNITKRGSSNAGEQAKKLSEMKSENKELFDRLTSILSAMGVDIGFFDDYKNEYLARTGYEFDGVALSDMMNKIILLKEQATIEDLAEEVGHFIVEALGEDNTAVKAALKDIEKTDIYQKVYENYKDNPLYQDKNGVPIIGKIKKEAVGQLLGEAIIKKNKEMQESLPKRLLNNLMRIVKSIVSKFTPSTAQDIRRNIEQTLGVVARDMITGKFVDFKENFSSDEIYHSNKASISAKILLKKSLKKLQERLKYHQRYKAGTIETARINKRIIEIKKAISDNEYEQGLHKFTANIQEEINDIKEEIQAYNLHKSTLDENMKDENGVYMGPIMDHARLLELNTFLEYYTPLLDDIRRLIKIKEMYTNPVYDNMIKLTLPGNTEQSYMSLREALRQQAGILDEDFKVVRDFYKQASVDLYLDTMEREKHEDEEFDFVASAEEVVGDMNLMSYFFGSLANANDGALRIVHKVLTNINHSVNRDTLAVGKDLTAFVKERGLTQKQLELLYETDGKGNATGYILSEFHMQKYEDSRTKFTDELYKELGLLNSEGERISKEDRELVFAKDKTKKRAWKKAWQKWLKENTEPIDNWRQIVEERRKILTPEQFNFWSSMNTMTVDVNVDTVEINGKSVTAGFESIIPAGELVKPKLSKYGNPEFNKITDKDLLEYREKLIDLKREMLFLQPESYYTMEAVYRLPQIGKTLIQRLKLDKAVFKQLPLLLKDEFTTKVDDDFLADLYTRQDGTTVKVVPIRYNRMLEETDDISRDITSLYVEYAHMANNFSQKNASAPELQNVVDIIASRNVKLKRERKPGARMNTLKALEKFLDMNLYGETKQNIEVEVMGHKINVTKILDKFNAWVRAKNLVGNFFSVFTGAMVGGAYGVIERLTGQYSSIESGRWAQKEFVSNFASVVSDIGNPVQTNFMELMFEEHNVFQSARETFEAMDKSRLGRIFSRKFFYGLYGAADYKMKGTMTLSIYDNYRLHEGKWYTKDQFMNKFYPSDKSAGKSAWSAIRDKSYWNAFEKVEKTKNGRVVSASVRVKEEFKPFLGKNEINLMTSRVRVINSRIDGVITEEDKAAVHQGAWSQLIATHRGWLFNGVAQRLKKKGINYATDQMEEGYYRTVFRGIKKYIHVVYNPKLMKNMMEDWKNLKDFERYNLLRSMYEMSAIIAMYTMALILNKAAEDEDDDDWTLQFAAYMSSRMLLETSVFAPPFVATELTSTLTNPIAGTRHIEDMMNIMDLFDAEDIRSGPYKDHSRAFKYLVKLTPGIRGWWELRDPASKNRYLKMKALKMYPGL